MAIVEPLVDYKRRSNSSEDEGLEDSHNKVGGKEVSPSTSI